MGDDYRRPMTMNNAFSSGTGSRLQRIALQVATGFLVLAFIFFAQPKTSKLSPRVKSAGPLNGKLLLVQGVFRHGARTPLSTLYWPDTQFSDCDNEYEGNRLELWDETGLPTPPPILDMDMPPLPGGCRMGQLTRAGYGMALDLGIWLRQRYLEDLQLLSPQYKAEEVSLRSTCIHRALQTLQGVTTGLFGPLRQPLRVNASREAAEFEYGNNVTCPALGPRYAALQAALAERDRKNSTLHAEAQAVTAALSLPSAAHNLSWVRLHDTLAAMAADDKPLPKGASPGVMKIIMAEATKREAAIIAPLPSDGLLPDQACMDTMRMGIGPLIWRLLGNMQQAAATASQRARSAAAAGPAVAAAAARSMRRGLAQSAHASEGQHQSRQRATRFAGMEAAHGVQPKQSQTRRSLRLQTAGAEPGAATAASTATASLHDDDSLTTEPQQPRMYLFSGHDSTITPLLAALGRPETEWPPFTASLVFELWELPGGGSRSGSSSGRAGSSGGSNGEDRNGNSSSGGRGRGVASSTRNTRKSSSYTAGAAEEQQQQQQYHVRVLYNRELLRLPGQSGSTVRLSDLASILSPYAADDAEHRVQCGR